MKRMLAILLLVGLAGCGGTLMGGSLGTSDPVALQKGVLTACKGAVTAERTLIKLINADKIPVSAFDEIDEARIVIKKFCGSGAPIPANPLDAVLQVGAAATALLAVRP